MALLAGPAMAGATSWRMSGRTGPGTRDTLGRDLLTCVAALVRPSAATIKDVASNLVAKWVLPIGSDA